MSQKISASRAKTYWKTATYVHTNKKVFFASISVIVFFDLSGTILYINAPYAKENIN